MDLPWASRRAEMVTVPKYQVTDQPTVQDVSDADCPRTFTMLGGKVKVTYGCGVECEVTDWPHLPLSVIAARFPKNHPPNHPHKE